MPPNAASTMGPWMDGGMRPAMRLCGSSCGGEEGLASGCGTSLTVGSMLPGTWYASRYPLGRMPQVSKSVYVQGAGQKRVGGWLSYWNMSGMASFRLNGLFASRSPIVSDSPHEIVCRPSRTKSGPFVMLTYDSLIRNGKLGTSPGSP